MNAPPNFEDYINASQPKTSTKDVPEQTTAGSSSDQSSEAPFVAASFMRCHSCEAVRSARPETVEMTKTRHERIEHGGKIGEWTAVDAGYAHSCQVCEFSFDRPASRSRHMSTMHADYYYRRRSPPKAVSSGELETHPKKPTVWTFPVPERDEDASVSANESSTGIENLSFCSCGLVSWSEINGPFTKCDACRTYVTRSARYSCECGMFDAPDGQKSLDLKCKTCGAWSHAFCVGQDVSPNDFECYRCTAKPRAREPVVVDLCTEEEEDEEEVLCEGTIPEKGDDGKEESASDACTRSNDSDTARVAEKSPVAANDLTPDDDIVWKCPLCYSANIHRGNVNTHIKQVHAHRSCSPVKFKAKDLLICAPCGVTFKSLTERGHHLRYGHKKKSTKKKSESANATAKEIVDGETSKKEEGSGELEPFRTCPCGSAVWFEEAGDKLSHCFACKMFVGPEFDLACKCDSAETPKNRISDRLGVYITCSECKVLSHRACVGNIAKPFVCHRCTTAVDLAAFEEDLDEGDADAAKDHVACPLCHSVRCSEYNMDRHMEICHPEESYTRNYKKITKSAGLTCFVCDKKFSAPSNRGVHYSFEHPGLLLSDRHAEGKPSPKFLACDLCDAVEEGTQRIGRHADLCHPDDEIGQWKEVTSEESRTCRACGDLFDSVKRVKTHVRFVHPSRYWKPRLTKKKASVSAPIEKPQPTNKRKMRTIMTMASGPISVSPLSADNSSHRVPIFTRDLPQESDDLPLPEPPVGPPPPPPPTLPSPLKPKETQTEQDKLLELQQEQLMLHQKRVQLAIERERQARLGREEAARQAQHAQEIQQRPLSDSTDAEDPKAPPEMPVQAKKRRRLRFDEIKQTGKDMDEDVSIVDAIIRLTGRPKEVAEAATTHLSSLDVLSVGDLRSLPAVAMKTAAKAIKSLVVATALVALADEESMWE